MVTGTGRKPGNTITEMPVTFLKVTKKNPINNMAKKKQETAEAPTKAFEIMAASIKDDFCNYTYEIKQGVGAGDTHQVKGKGIVDPDMLASFAKLNVHLAVLDDVYAHSGIEIDDIDKFHGHELSTRYTVTGIKVKGDAENKSVILVGTKFITCASGRIETMKIVPDDKGLLAIWNTVNGRWKQLTNVTFTKN